jgi:hypothetical protein
MGYTVRDGRKTGKIPGSFSFAAQMETAHEIILNELVYI